MQQTNIIKQFKICPVFSPANYR